MMLVVLPSALLWAAAGSTPNRLLTRSRPRRYVSFGLAALLVATVTYIWL